MNEYTQSQRTSHRGKRARSPDLPASSSPPGRATVARRDSQSSLPPSSPPAPFSDTDDSMDERDVVRDIDDEEDEEGEDLFGQDMAECVLVSSIYILLLNSNLSAITQRINSLMRFLIPV